ncbi:MAG TPA: DUF6624 domain-containing protein [Puia sp.]|uniref:DUF6624 domain-containing protein n=1 Tax=Puia sp. TaxID=2045100 RepID=UPI002B62B44E|nr:DUF6624 domain-containing protein [Puia sp.]HVU98061.1 DUF6624 domain-containing protein [Puia sp.]
MRKILLLPFIFLPVILFAQGQHTLMDTLRAQLEIVFKADQQYRLPLEGMAKKYGWNSHQVDSLYEGMSIRDSIDLGIVTHILDTYGWIGTDSIGPSGSTTLWVVIQHADPDVQKKYLPMMRTAVAQGRAHANELAYLEDRVALEEGRKQTYGTQFQLNKKTNKYIIAPIEDEPNVDRRRAAIGLEPLEDYARDAGIAYKLPASPPAKPAQGPDKNP